MPHSQRPVPLVLLPGRLNDHEVFLLAWSVFLGCTFVLGAPPPASIAAEVSHPVFVSWAVAVALSGMAGLVGCYWRGRADIGLGVERGALLMQSGCWLFFAALVIRYAGAAGITAAGIILAWAAANLARAWRITRALAALRREVPAHEQ